MLDDPPFPEFRKPTFKMMSAKRAEELLAEEEPDLIFSLEEEVPVTQALDLQGEGDKNMVSPFKVENSLEQARKELSQVYVPPTIPTALQQDLKALQHFAMTSIWYNDRHRYAMLDDPEPCGIPNPQPPAPEMTQWTMDPTPPTWLLTPPPSFPLPSSSSMPLPTPPTMSLSSPSSMPLPALATIPLPPPPIMPLTTPPCMPLPSPPTIPLSAPPTMPLPPPFILPPMVQVPIFTPNNTYIPTTNAESAYPVCFPGCVPFYVPPIPGLYLTC